VFFFERRRIERAPNGAIRLRLPEGERALLRTLRAELQSLLDDNPSDPDLRRLFPPAHDDPEREAEYRGLVGAQLLAGRARALETLERTVDRGSLSADEADAWLRALNDARLVLGTRLDVTQDMDWDELDPSDPQTRDLAVYAYLSWLQEQLVEALAAGVDPPAP
jgi:Domain of unknown function (DUF2017)